MPKPSGSAGVEATSSSRPSGDGDGLWSEPGAVQGTAGLWWVAGGYLIEVAPIDDEFPPQRDGVVNECRDISRLENRRYEQWGRRAVARAVSTAAGRGEERLLDEQRQAIPDMRR